MSLRRTLLASLVTAVGGSVLAVAPLTATARADVDPAVAGAALDLPTGVSATVTGSGSVESQAFNDFPSKGADYVVLSTGDADAVMLSTPLDIDDPTTSEDEWGPDPDRLSTDLGVAGPDTSTLSLTVQPAAGAGCLLIDFSLATDETVRAALPDTPADSLSVVRRADPSTEYAVNAGRGYFAQEDWPTQPRAYTTNSIDYWHRPGITDDVLNGQLEVPRLARWTRLDHVTTKDTARVPLDFGSGADVVDVSVADGPHDGLADGEIDSAAFVDNVRLAPSCAAGAAAQPANPYGDGSIKGERRVGYPLSYDPFPSTVEIERYDAANNGWSHPAPAAPTDLRFRWYRTKISCSGPYNSDMTNWVAIPDADRQSYVPTNLDKGHCLIVLVSGVVDGRPVATFPNTAEAGTNPERWYVTTAIGSGVFQDGSTPTIDHDGTPKVGEEITATPVPTSPLQNSWVYQWYADGSSITGATSSSLVLGAAQRGKAITVRTTAKRSGFDDRSWTSTATPKVLGDVMESVGSPTIADQADGEPPAVGDQLVADAGAGWPEGTSFTYQWRRSGTAIAGATQPSYTATSSDAGKSLTVVVTGSKPGYDPAAAISPAVTVKGAPMAGGTPTISGTPKVGVKLTAYVSDWVPSGSTFTYAWYAGGVLLQQGTSRYYTPTAATAGKQIVLQVTGTRSGYEPLAVASSPTSPVAKGTLTTGRTRISGTPMVGYTLRAYTPYWGPSPVAFKYRWKIGSTYVAAPAGTRSYLKLPARARGKRITLVVTVSKAGYGSVTTTAVSSAVR